MVKKFLTVERRENVGKRLAELFDISLKTEKLSILDSVNRFSAETIFASFNIPSFKKSLVDGFAVVSDNTKGASSGNPIPLKLIKDLRIGEALDKQLRNGETVFVPTGGVVPDEADAVVMIEYTEKHSDEIFVMQEVHKKENLIETGDDIKKGKVILSKGERITPNRVAVLRTFGIKDIAVFGKIKLGIFSTGDELIDSGKLPKGRIYDINEYALFAEATNGNFSPKMYGIVKDNKLRIKETLKKALSENDMVLMSGGTSKGSFDFTVSVINELGTPGVQIHGLHLSPGKPTVFGIVNGKLVVGLSGNPLASFLVFREVVVPFIYNKCGLKIEKQKVIAILSENLPSRKGREEFVMGKLFTKDGEQFVRPIFSESAFVSPLTESEGIITVPLMSEGFKKGEKVIVELW
jgi:molybdopterin molybdotransferase